VREHNADRFSVYIIAMAIVMFFAALPAGIFIVNLLQQTLFIRESQFFFETPRSAFIAFIITLMIVPLVMILLVLVKFRTHEKKAGS
jgi:Zn-dependent protease with chaperone function